MSQGNVPITEPIQAKAAVLEALQDALNAGRWMAAVWVIKDGKITMINRTTFNFEKGDYLASVGQLAASCATDMIEPVIPVPDPLPPAPGFEDIN